MAYWKVDVFEKIANEGLRQKIESSIFRCPLQYSAAHPKSFSPAALTVGPYASKDAREYEQLNKYKVKVATAVLKGKNLELKAGLETLVKVIVGSGQELAHYASPFDQDMSDVQRILAIDSLFVSGLLLTCLSWFSTGSFPESVSSQPSVMQIINNFPGFEVKEDPVLLVQNVVFFPDLFLLGNQVPLSFLKRALMFVVGDQLTEDLAGDLLIRMTTYAIEVVSFFKYPQDLLKEIVDLIKSRMSLCPHLLDFFYKVTTCCMYLNDTEDRASLDFHVPSISELLASGIQLIPREGPAIYARYYSDLSRIVLPTIEITKHTEHLVRNLLAYEVLTVSKPVLTTYARLMDKLVNSPDDVRIMEKNGVITGDEVGDQKRKGERKGEERKAKPWEKPKETSLLMRTVADMESFVSIPHALAASGWNSPDLYHRTAYTVAGFYQV
ncbi:hypothetical protein R1sor_022715 [Riccia sorocarpa]|uniref:Uncharacterized protein n=1 Tax=Riccia sorocarpa TaxID=122646 RepID=A0ABD3GRK2_9MARC